jgi:hypothetical protein
MSKKKRPGITFEEAREQDPDAFLKSQRTGGYKAAEYQPEPEWLYYDADEFERWLEKREGSQQLPLFVENGKHGTHSAS